MDPVEVERMLKLTSIFMPGASRLLKAFHGACKRVVHYTSAENLMRIITSKTMWLRNTNCMVDYREVYHGYEMLVRFFQQQAYRDAFVSVLEDVYPGVAMEALNLFDGWWRNGGLQFNIYIASVSEHEECENTYGRLSMWRGFGSANAPRAAMVMNVPKPGEAEGLHLFLAPVRYFEYEQLETEMLEMISNIKNNTDFLKSLGRDRIQTMIFHMLIGTAVSIKHPGFSEEKEWRIIYLPLTNPSSLIHPSTEVIGGIPQIIYKVPLEDNPDEGVVGVGIPTLIERIIIGPSVYPVPMHMAFADALAKAGVPNAAIRVVASNIPIRS